MVPRVLPITSEKWIPQKERDEISFPPISARGEGIKGNAENNISFQQGEIAF